MTSPRWWFCIVKVTHVRETNMRNLSSSPRSPVVKPKSNIANTSPIVLTYCSRFTLLPTLAYWHFHTKRENKIVRAPARVGEPIIQ